MQEELGFPDKSDKRAQPGTVTTWTPAELNNINNHFVAGEFTTFGCVEWQSQLIRGGAAAGPAGLLSAIAPSRLRPARSDPKPDENVA